MVVRRILCVAEKNSISKAVAGHLGGQYQTGNIRGTQYVKNYSFDYTFNNSWGPSSVVFTAVSGHIMQQEFPSRFKNWNNTDPWDLFEAPIEKSIDEKNQPIANNIKQHAQRCSILYIWTDCDREGENIGAEIRQIALSANPRIEIKRAHFSNIERTHIIQAANNPLLLDDNQVNAIESRMELDLRTGAAFTRVLTLSLQDMIKAVDPELGIISYGSCQFPTLGFVVNQYLRVKNFVPEPFWSIKITHKKEDEKNKKPDQRPITVNFNWVRGHLFDRMAVVLLFERCLNAKFAKVIKMERKPTSKWRPLPLTTVELQKNGSRFLQMNSSRVMAVAEGLYQKGWISYPRTETDQFDREINCQALCQKQTQSREWGPHAQGLVNGNFRQPRRGTHNDKAHPPIHPVNYVEKSTLSHEEQKVYEFVVRRFLACCSDDAKGEKTTVAIDYGAEIFNATGLIVLHRNYLEVYPYEKWEDSQQLPEYQVGETFIPTEAKMTEGKTSPPHYITEPELITLMDKNGIGTDATMAEHISKIKERNYVESRPATAAGRLAAASDEGDTAPATRGRGGARGRGRGGRGGATASARGATRGVEEFVPTTLGIALIEGYENLNFSTSLSKPFLRKEMELQMKAICDGQRTRNDVVQENIERYRAVYMRTKDQMSVLKAAVNKYIVEPERSNGS
ncbi:prokaryotic type I DNA topoisomerase [Microthyrium microscopicum]|uniref:DNA topoisomerase n=1 Tax=Microthyrium microscopicum TaxID=703497 RepID=A0A6A6TWG0_9PEZI|nr:prokaryotic type I DNA topoisomerase [Microthyrium microscopicum]